MLNVKHNPWSTYSSLVPKRDTFMLETVHMFVQIRGGQRKGLEPCPRGQKCNTVTNFAPMNSNTLLASLFEQLHYEFLDVTNKNNRPYTSILKSK